MRYALLDTVVLNRDLPARDLHEGDLGAIVEVYEPDGLEVEFVAPSGQTRALVTLMTTDVRPITANGIAAARRFDRPV